MKRLLPLIISLMTLCLMATPATARKYGETLRILAIGNSFSNDGMEHLPALLEDLGIENVELARLHIGGCSLERHVKCYNTQEASYEFYHSKAGENRWVKSEEMVPMQHALEMGEWDIITLQQVSGLSGKYESYVPHLDRLIAIVSKAQPQAELVWHMTWSYSTNSRHNDFARYERSSQKMLEAIYDATHAATEAHSEIEIIIPCGTAIQSLRQSAINNSPRDLTRDGYHMGEGAGRYALACTWYEELIEPYTNISMRGNTLRVNKGSVNVSPIVAAYCQKAARMAVRHNFTIREVKHVEREMRRAKRGNKEKIIE